MSMAATGELLPYKESLLRHPPPRPDTATALSVALLLVVIGQCVGAPAGAGVRAVVPLRPEVWRRPCGETEEDPVVPAAGNPQRHHAKHMFRIVKPVWQLTTLANKHYKEKLPVINDLYGDVQGLSRYEYDWLPKNNFKWFRDNAQCKNIYRKVEKVLPHFHSTLQNYSVTFDAMRTYGETHIADDGNTYRRRNVLLEEVASYHKNLLCEVTSAMHILHINGRGHASGDILPEGKWKVNPDYTGLRIRDWGVFQPYRTFLEEWNTIMNQVMKKQKPCRKRSNRGKGTAS